MKKFTFLITFLLVLSHMTPVFSQNKKESAVVVTETVAPEVNVIGSKLYIKNAPVGKRVQIITIIGNKVRDLEIKLPETEIDLSSLPKAIYIVKLEGVVKKFVIK
jgi:hypothetical protein